MSSKKGFYVSKGTAAASVIGVVVLLVVEGLLVGLVGRPTCDTANAPGPEPVTSTPPKVTTTSGATTTGSPEVWESNRLPLNLVPSKYKVLLKPVLEKDEAAGLYIFYGSSSVQYTCMNSTDLVILNSIELNYTDSWKNNFQIIDINDGTEIIVNDVSFYERNEYLILKTEKSCLEGHEYNLSIASFSGELGDDADGLHRSEYVDEYGRNRVIATTQMQDTGARRTFPCFDEPAFKAQFEITLLYREDLNYSAISNMPPALNETVIDDEGILWNSTTFEWTPIMSSYLLAMIVSDFSSEDASTVDGIQTRIYARNVPVRNGETNYAAKVSPAILKGFETHFNVAYPLAKSDQVAIPHFGGGAMENWGLVIYQEINLLYDPTVTSVYTKYSVVEIVSHELAHQWFGNLVTNAWWSDLWLNEGFASYVQYIGINIVRPSWQADELFIVENLQRGLAADDSSDSHPLHHPLGYLPSRVTYSKGASFIRMVNDFIGEETFTNALTNYLLGNQYNVATYQILFQYLAEEAEKDNVPLPDNVSLEEILEPWVLQMGYPLLSITSEGNNFIVTQEYFLIDPDDTPQETPGSQMYNYAWHVPFTYKFASCLTSPKNYSWMNPTNSITIPMNGEEYILGNIDGIGFYRVNYDKSMWSRITKKLQSKERNEISPQNRAQLIDDVFAITRSGRISIEVALELASYLESESDYICWETFTIVMVYFDSMLGSSKVYGNFSSFISDMVTLSIYNELGWNDTNTAEDAQIKRMTRGLAIDTACHYGNTDCIETAQAMFQTWMNNPENNMISSTYRSDVYCTAIRAGGIAEWDFAWNQYLTVDSAQEQSNLRYGMSCSKDAWIINRYIEYCLDNTKVRNQDISSTLSYIASHEHSKYIAWSFAQNNWDLMMNTVGSGATSSMLNSAKRRFSTEFDLDLIDSLRDTAGPAWNSTLNSYYNEVLDNMEWRMNNEEKVAAWLRGESTPETLARKSLKHKKLDVVKKIKEDKKVFHKRFQL